MEYNLVGNFLDKFKKILFQKEILIKTIVMIIEEELYSKIDSDTIKIKNGIIFISGSPVFKNELFIHKKQILEKINNSISGIKILDLK